MIALRNSRTAMCLSLALAALVSLWPGRALAGSDPRVSALLDRMTKAVLEGDIEKYLACVDQSDPVFWKEQQNWAADFKRHVPKEFALRIDAEKMDVKDRVATVPLTMTWKMELPDSRERELSYSARLIEHDGGWLYAGENWETVEGGGIKVMYAGGLAAVAQTVVDILPDIRKHVDEGFGIHIGRVQEVKLYTSMRHLQQSIYLSYTDGLAGWNEPGESIKILANRRTDAADLEPLLAHEYGHVATFELGPKANTMPWWILEGVAELAAERYGHPRSVDAMVKSWARQGRLVPWDQLSDFHTVKDSHQMHVYSQGHHMIGFISDRFGRAGRNRWLTAMSQGTSLDEATREMMGTDFAGLDEMWRASLAPKEEEVPAGAGTD